MKITKEALLQLIRESIRENDILLESPLDLEEGVNDPGIFKAVFLAGGPGSGKSFVTDVLFGLRSEDGNKVFDKVSFSPSGLKVVNSDTLFEMGLEKAGIDKGDLAKISKENPELWDKIQKHDDPESIRNIAKNLSDKRFNNFLDGRLGVIIDGTGGKYNKISGNKEMLENLGYDTMMVFIDVDLDVAQARNAKRERKLGKDLVDDLWHKVQENKQKYEALFGEDFIYIDNNEYKPVADEVMKVSASFVNSPVTNPAAQEWINSQTNT